MSAFFIFHNRSVRDADLLARYKAAAAPVVAAYGGTYRVLGGDTSVLEGAWRPSFLVLVEFPSRKLAAAWYESEDYRELKAMRLAAVDSEAVLLTGLDEAPDPL